ncbi:MAG: hypothetical protein EBZ47_04755 [Chlamydiae bacterium]|nr:hypothetical protein [Chlamydiota bacterium]
MIQDLRLDTAVPVKDQLGGAEDCFDLISKLQMLSFFSPDISLELKQGLKNPIECLSRLTACLQDQTIDAGVVSYFDEQSTDQRHPYEVLKHRLSILLAYTATTCFSSAEALQCLDVREWTDTEWEVELAKKTWKEQLKVWGNPILFTDFCKSAVLDVLKIFLLNESDPLKKMGWQDYIDSLSKISENDFLMKSAWMLIAEKYQKGFVERSISFLGSKEFDTIESAQKVCDRALIVFADFKNLPILSETKLSHSFGILKSSIIKFTSFFKHSAHSFCGCHASKQGRPALWPLHHPPFTVVEPGNSQTNLAESVVVLGCGYGTGHKQASVAVSNLVADLGYHPYTVDVPEEILKEEDMIYSSLHSYLGNYAPDWNIGTLFNGLITRKAFATINMLSGKDPASGRLPSPPESPPSMKAVKKIAQRILLLNPVAVVINYYPDLAPSIEAAKLLGLPIIHTHTDVSPQELKWRILGPTYPHFTEALAFEGYSDVIVPSILSDDQLAVVGPPCNPIFEKPFTKAEVASLRLKWNIVGGKKLLLLSNGSNGTSAYPPYVHFVLEKYSHSTIEEVPFHLIVLCGRGNEGMAENLMKYAREKIPLQAYAAISSSEMKELMAIASEGGALIGKPGGLTVFESVKMKTPIIFDNIGPDLFSHSLLTTLVNVMNVFAKRVQGFSNTLPWEAENRDFMVNKKQGVVCESKENFSEILDSLVSSQDLFAKEVFSKDKTFSQAFPSLFEKKVKQSQEDPINDSNYKRRQDLNFL